MTFYLIGKGDKVPNNLDDSLKEFSIQENTVITVNEHLDPDNTAECSETKLLKDGGNG